MERGFFNDSDLSLYGLGRTHFSDFGRLENEFFGSDDFKRFTQSNKSGVFEKSKKVVKHTRIENGQRRTITETKTVEPDGRVDKEIKEEVDDGKGNKQVRYLDALPAEMKLARKGHSGQQGQGQAQMKSLGQQATDKTGNQQMQSGSTGLSNMNKQDQAQTQAQGQGQNQKTAQN